VKLITVNINVENYIKKHMRSVAWNL